VPKVPPNIFAPTPAIPPTIGATTPVAAVKPSSPKPINLSAVVVSVGCSSAPPATSTLIDGPSSSDWLK
jgi:hypothetical protein